MPSTPARPAPLVDTHCHVDLYPDPAVVIKGIEQGGVYTIAVTNTPSVFDRLCEIANSARFVRVALGLHPELATERHRELPLFKARLERTRYVGEVGLDYQTIVEADRATQRRVLTTIIECCNTARDKVVTVHSRRAADDVVDAFGEHFNGHYVLHWYSGSARTLRRAIANGAYVSVNPAMAHSERGRSLIAEVPRPRVLSETDGPFVTVGSKPAVPADVESVLVMLAEMWAVDVAEARGIVYNNFSDLLNDSPRTG